MFTEQSISLDDAVKQGTLPALETFPCPYDSASLNSGIIRIIFPEFTCICPKSGYPDFASIGLYYQPDKLCVELKAWKIYLNAFRMIGTFHETVTAHLFDTIKAVLQPKWALVIGNFLPRGNVDTTVVFETDTARPTGADILLEDIKPLCKGLD